MNTKNTKPTAPLAHRVPAEVSATIQEYSLWLESQCGVKIDALSVYLGSQLRGTWQKSADRQAELADAAKQRAAQDAAKAKARAEREAAAAAKTAKPVPATKAATKKAIPRAGATIATPEGVVIAEQRHVEAVQA